MQNTNNTGVAINPWIIALTVMLAGAPDALDDFEELMRSYGIVELQRTGRVALPKLGANSGSTAADLAAESA